jgi:hypothetical protein
MRGAVVGKQGALHVTWKMPGAVWSVGGGVRE